MRADADDALRKLAANIVDPVGMFCQALARILSGDLDGCDAFLEDVANVAEQVGASQTGAEALCERSLLAMKRGKWDQAGDFAGQAAAALRRGGTEGLLACAVQARVAAHRGDVAAARQQLVSAQRLRPVATYAIPCLAVQARIELIRVNLALADVAGAKTLMREIDEVLKRRPDLGTLVGEARELRARLSAEHAPSAHGASSLTAAELRLLPMLATHQQMHEIAAEMYLSPHTVRAQGKSIYRKLGASSRSQAIARARKLGLLEG